MTAEYDLLRKSELRLSAVKLDGADLGQLAAAVASVLELDRGEVVVTDYLDDVLTFDILRPTLYSHQLLGRRDALLDALRAQCGVSLGEDATVTANGMLGWIAGERADVEPALRAAQHTAAEIESRIARRVGVFSTGAELVGGDVKDTNAQTLENALTANGFAFTFLAALPDDRDLIAGSIRRAVDDGYGVVITTGGVGAEAKDCTVEAVLTLCPAAATPYTCRFEPGHGRHVKDGVRIAVATLRGSRIICLPGPTHEVRECLRPLLTGLNSAQSDSGLAQALAETLRQTLHERMGHPNHRDQ
ncbi:molybdopterin-binding protein [Mycobacterium sp. E796]|uniref:molybdopterin-binding protein n=1 Tax=Mycobacterium sp. E796 TaxID=1834151 RepID=UPI0007FE0D93|nr:molybdopterin-binding protein [Mycobacterium sp. E796]OBI51994.1 hypothetical protein A5706_02010 [Mycobacterium sp. E796]